MTYYLSLADAKLLLTMACSYAVRSDEAHAALYGLATWLDEHNPLPENLPGYREWATDSREVDEP